MGLSADREAPHFELESPALAGQRLALTFGSYHLTLTYDEQGRLLGAESVNHQVPLGYSARLTLLPDVPAGHFTNSFGDRDDWEANESVTSGSYGPFEQHDRETMPYRTWVMRALVAMCGRNAD